MKTLYVKELNCPKKHLVQWNEDGDVSVAAIKAAAEEELDIPVNEQVIVFGGRILKDDKTLEDYNVKEGCTIHVLRKTTRQERSDEAVEMESLEGISDAQYENRQQVIEELVAEVVHNPQLLQEVLLRGEVVLSDSDSRAIAIDPNMVDRLRDPDFVRSMLDGHSSLVEALRRHLSMWNIPQPPDYTNSNSAMAIASPGSSISSAHLAAALARAQGGQSNLLSVDSTSSGTSHLGGALPFDLPSDSPDSLMQPVLSRQQSSSSQADHQATNVTGTIISSAALSQALAGATSSSGTSHTRWAQQLEQIQEFGVWDQAACIHALDETGGDVEAAIELLANQGII
ncbi:ubiquitin-like protein 7 isoform X2 [Corticium candelabrum]|uniref:ubiquitin-like protein 7 isoform X2 n=1 Tax=Corticium candelabrum TaxID=121492 RepID=UPI002E255E21|nr:ubiquitin-like protein 7 isoform X2 [Corticium candelabrum]